MRTTLFIVALVLSTSLILGATRAASLAASDSWGGDWKVKVTPDDDSHKNGGKAFDEVLTFKGAKFVGAEMQKHGFGPCDYQEDTRRAGPATFTAKSTSDTEGTADWQGLETSGEATGTLVWTKKDGTVLNYTFTGSKGN